MFASGFPDLGSFSVAPAENLESNILPDLSTIYHCSFHTLFVYIPSIRGQEMMLVLPSQLVSKFFHTRSMFWFFPASLMPSTYTDKNSPFSRFTNKHSQFGTFPQSYSNQFSRIAFPTTVLPMDDHRDFARERRLGQSCWTMISAICVVADGSKHLNILNLEFSESAHLPVQLGHLHLHLQPVLRIPAALP